MFTSASSITNAKWQNSVVSAESMKCSWKNADSIDIARTKKQIT